MSNNGSHGKRGERGLERELSGQTAAGGIGGEDIAPAAGAQQPATDNAGTAEDISHGDQALGRADGPEGHSSTPQDAERRPGVSAVPSMELVARLREVAAPPPTIDARHGPGVEAPDSAEHASSPACAHLGMEQNPFAHRAEPSSHHRCYLWMQRDRIDLAHQGMFCLTSQSARCPWLSISNPKQPVPMHRRAAQAIAERLPARLDELDNNWQRALLTALVTIVAELERAWRFVEPALLQLGLWLLVGLRFIGPISIRPVIALSHLYRSLERRAWAAILAAPRLLWRAASGLSLRGAATTRTIAQPDVPAPEIKVLGQEVALTTNLQGAEPAVDVAHNERQVAGSSSIEGRAAEKQPAETGVQAVIAEAVAAAEDYLRRGMEAIRDGDHESALRRFRLATAADPKNEQAWLLRGTAAGSHEEKEDCFRQALALNPNSIRARAGLSQLGIVPPPIVPKVTGQSEFATLYEAGAGAGHEEGLDGSWDCAHCGTANPSKVELCERCGSASPAIERQEGQSGDLLRSGLNALQVGSEELAYEYFSAAAKAEPTNEQAWYWRAKTAPTLDELIQCLQHIIELNPNNRKVQADLKWAMHRRQRASAPQPTAVAAAPPAVEPVAKSRVVALIRGGLLQLAALGAFVSALALTLPSVASLADLATVPEFKPVTSRLPVFTMPSIPIHSDFAPAFDLGPALPVILGVLLFQMAFRLGDGGGRMSRYWSAALAASAVVLLSFYTVEFSLAITVVALATIAMGLAGRAGEVDAQPVKSVLR